MSRLDPSHEPRWLRLTWQASPEQVDGQTATLVIEDPAEERVVTCLSATDDEDRIGRKTANFKCTHPIPTLERTCALGTMDPRTGLCHT